MVFGKTLQGKSKNLWGFNFEFNKRILQRIIYMKFYFSMFYATFTFKCCSRFVYFFTIYYFYKDASTNVMSQREKWWTTKTPKFASLLIHYLHLYYSNPHNPQSTANAREKAQNYIIQNWKKTLYLNTQ